MKKSLFLCSLLLLAPVALFFLSSSSNNLSELEQQNVESLSWGDNNQVPPYPNMALLPIETDTINILNVTVAGEANLFPTLKIMDSRLEVDCEYNILLTGYRCWSDYPGCYCPPGSQTTTIVGLWFKKRNVRPKM